MKELTEEIVKASLDCHKAAENLEYVIKKAVGDSRFKQTLADARAFRDLSDDTLLMIERAWVKSLEIPLNLRFDKRHQITEKAETKK